MWLLLELLALSDQLEWRPTSDHTRTGLNAATDMTGLRFALDALDEISMR